MRNPRRQQELGVHHSTAFAADPKPSSYKFLCANFAAESGPKHFYSSLGDVGSGVGSCLVHEVQCAKDWPQLDMMSIDFPCQPFCQLNTSRSVHGCLHRLSLKACIVDLFAPHFLGHRQLSNKKSVFALPAPENSVCRHAILPWGFRGSSCFSRNVRSSWPPSGRHSHTNHIPWGSENAKTMDGRQKSFCFVKIKLITP